MSEKARDLLFSSQQLTYQHKLLGDTMAVGSDWARVQMPNLGSPCVAFLPNHCHPTWPSTLLLGECATVQHARNSWVGVHTEAGTVSSLVGKMGSWFLSPGSVY